MRDGTDEYWVGRAIRDPEAFSELVERYQSRMFSLAYRLLGDREDAADAAQETFVRAYRSLGTFRLDARFSPWIYKIAVNVCFNIRKGQSSRPETLLDESMEGNDPSPHALSETTELRADLTRAIASLSPNYRTAVVLRHIHDLPYEDIAESMGVPLGTVKTWLFRAREQLQIRLTPVRNARG